MTSGRLLLVVSALCVTFGACAVPDGQTPAGPDGSSATGDASVQGGTTGNAGTGGSGAGGSGAGGNSSTAGQSGTAGSAGSGASAGSTGAAGTGGAAGMSGAAGAGVAGAAGTMATAGAGGASGAAGTAAPAGRGGSSVGGGTAIAGAGGAGGTGGAGGAIPLKNPPVPSAGCGKATTVTTGKKTITSTNQQRSYIIDIPTNYDMNKPYRLFYTSHWIGSTSEAVRDQNYYFLKPLATAANEPAIFVAPQSDGSTWQQKDHALFDDILAYVKQNLCIDTTRVFATGFSFGGMITYSLSLNHQKDIRAAVGIAPANYNIYIPTKTRQPIAWMQTTGLSDGTCPWVNGSSTTQGAKYIAIEHATNNGCTVPANIPVWQQGNHVCYDFQGCRTEYPTKACTFNGGHTNIANDSGSSTNWIATESWNFFRQF
jgi:poly(3-hydroxybutyrate) depolymerase